MPQNLHQQPRAIAARTASQIQRFLSGLNARLHADQIFHIPLEQLIQTHQKINRPLTASLRDFFLNRLEISSKLRSRGLDGAKRQ